MGFYTPSTNQVLLPVWGVKVCIANRISSVIHTVISSVNAHMGYICASVIRAVEEYQITSLCLCQWDMLGCVVLVLSHTG